MLFMNMLIFTQCILAVAAKKGNVLGGVLSTDALSNVFKYLSPAACVLLSLLTKSFSKLWKVKNENGIARAEILQCAFWEQVKTSLYRNFAGNGYCVGAAAAYLRALSACDGAAVLSGGVLLAILQGGVCRSNFDTYIIDAASIMKDLFTPLLEFFVHAQRSARSYGTSYMSHVGSSAILNGIERIVHLDRQEMYTDNEKLTGDQSSLMWPGQFVIPVHDGTSSFDVAYPERQESKPSVEVIIISPLSDDNTAMHACEHFDIWKLKSKFHLSLEGKMKIYIANAVGIETKVL